MPPVAAIGGIPTKAMAHTATKPCSGLMSSCQRSIKEGLTMDINALGACETASQAAFVVEMREN
jgi:hypothetical protein